jgi:hypothetical protein
MTAGLIASGTFDDPANARVIYLAVAGLLLLATLLAVGTWWWWRSSKVEHPVLGPLEVMSTRRWWKGDFHDRQRRLEAVRPDHVDPEDADAPALASAVDLDHVLVRVDPHSFDDLLEPDVVPDAELEEVHDAAPDAAPPAVAAVAARTPDEPIDVHSEHSERERLDEQTVAGADSTPAPETASESVPEPVLRSIVIDTAPKPRDTPSDLGPESADSDPTPAPIDPLLRLPAE